MKLFLTHKHTALPIAMSTHVHDIILIVQARLQELHPPQPSEPKGDITHSAPREDEPEIKFSVRPKWQEIQPSTPPKPPQEPYVESTLPDWAQTLMGRIGIRKDERVPPNLHASNPSFAARILIAVRDRFKGYAAPLYLAANVDRRLYSKIISDERRPVSRDTALAFAFALRLNSKQAQELLQSAGHALSTTNDRDVILTACFDNHLYEIAKVNEVLKHFHQPTLG